MTKDYQGLFTPFSIGSVEVKNRFVMAPMGTMVETSAFGTYTQQAVDYYAARARGGVGLIITGANWVENQVEQHVDALFPCPTQSPALYRRTATELTDRVHAFGTKIFLQLTAGIGRSGIPRKTVFGECVAPSPVSNRWNPREECRELTIPEIESIIKSFTKAALTAKRCGFDGVEVHAVHEGYLLDCFAMSLFNQRTDRYGGDVEGRLRFATEIVQGIKASCGQDFPVVLRFGMKSYMKDLRQGALPGEPFQEIGRDVEESLEIAALLERAGYDAFDADAGTYDSWYWAHPPMYFDRGVYLPLTEKLKQAVHVPVLVAGFMDDPDMAQDALRTGKLDAVGLGRPLLSDPQYVRKLHRGDVEDIRPCLGCHDGCFGRSFSGRVGSCAVNPECAREGLVGIAPAARAKRVVVVGGGPGGMEAARVSALRGHSVILLESRDQLGGNLVPGGVPSFKQRDRELVAWYKGQMAKLGVEVRLNTAADRESILALEPDVVFLATGSVPISLPIQCEGLGSCSAEQILLGEVTPGPRCVIVGGGLVGCELALHLREQGHSVTILEARSDILKGGMHLPPMNDFMLRDLLKFHGVDIRCNTYAKKADGDGVLTQDAHSTQVLPADTLIQAVGYRSTKGLYETLQADVEDIFCIGDAQKVRGIMDAIWSGYEVARHL